MHFVRNIIRQKRKPLLGICVWRKCTGRVAYEQRLSLQKLWHDAVTLCNPLLWSHRSWLMQQAGGGWGTDQAQGERGDLQHSARASAHGGLLPDPKEDANRVIEDILAVSAPPAQNPALVLSPCYGDSQQCMWGERDCKFILLASCSMGEEAALDTTILSAEEQCGHWGSCMDCTLWRQAERCAQQIHSAAGRLK